MATAIPAIKATVLAVLEAAAKPEAETALSGVHVAGPGPEPERKKEYIWVRSGSAKRAIKVLNGPRVPRLDEDVKVRVLIVAIGGDDPDGRVYELQSAAEEALRDNETLDGACSWHFVEDVDDDVFLVDTKRKALVLMTLSARIRI